MKETAFVEALRLLADEKGIAPDILAEKIKTAIEIAIRRDFPYCEDADFNIDLEKSRFEVRLVKEVVEEFDNPDDDKLLEMTDYDLLLEDARRQHNLKEAGRKILLADAKKIDPKYNVGDKCLVKLGTEQFGRVAAGAAKQVIRQGLKEIEKDKLIAQWGNLQDRAVSASVVEIDMQGNIIVSINNGRVTLFRGDIIPGEMMGIGDIIKVYVNGVSADDRKPFLKVSRTHNRLVTALFKIECPEVEDGTVEIKAASREPGVRAKIAVLSNDPNVEAIGSLVGPGRSRINSVSHELAGEKIDLIKWSEDTAEFIKQAMKPAEVLQVEIPDQNARACVVTVPDNQLSLAIRAKGLNAKLAARLTGFSIDIKPESGFFEGS